jgi:RHS repeat-associated protein
VTYDAAGDVTYDGTNAYVYDAEGRIASVNSGAATYVYDAGGQRVGTIDSARGQIYYYYDLDGRVVFESAPGGRIRMEYYVGGRHLVTYGAATVFNHPNWLGTEQYRTTTTGTQYEYCINNPFGDNMYCASNQGDLSRVHFTGKERDNYDTSNLTNLDNFGARYYFSNMARFMSPDPDNTGADSLNPQSWNMYAYVLNNPLISIDPTGLECLWEDGSYDSNDDPSTGAAAVDGKGKHVGCTGAGGQWPVG